MIAEFVWASPQQPDIADRAVVLRHVGRTGPHAGALQGKGRGSLCTWSFTCSWGDGARGCASVAILLNVIWICKLVPEVLLSSRAFPVQLLAWLAIILLLSPGYAGLLFSYRRSLMVDKLCTPPWGNLSSYKAPAVCTNFSEGSAVFWKVRSLRSHLCQKKWEERRKHGTGFSCRPYGHAFSTF